MLPERYPIFHIPARARSARSARAPPMNVHTFGLPRAQKTRGPGPFASLSPGHRHLPARRAGDRGACTWCTGGWEAYTGCTQGGMVHREAYTRVYPTMVHQGGIYPGIHHPGRHREAYPGIYPPREAYTHREAYTRVYPPRRPGRLYSRLFPVIPGYWEAGRLQFPVIPGYSWLFRYSGFSGMTRIARPCAFNNGFLTETVKEILEWSTRR